jgi:hypothetical protein
MSDLFGGSTNQERGQAAYLRKKYRLRNDKNGLIFLYFLNDIIHHNTDSPYMEGIQITDRTLRDLHRSLKGAESLLGPDPILQFQSFEELSRSNFFRGGKFTKEFLKINRYEFQ